MVKKVAITFLILLLGALGIYGVYAKFNPIKRMDRDAVVLLSSLLIGAGFYIFVLHVISNRPNRAMSAKTLQGWLRAARLIRLACILCACYLGFGLTLCLYPSLLPDAGNQSLSSRLMILVGSLLKMTLHVLYFGWLSVELIETAIAPAIKNNAYGQTEITGH